MQAQIPAQRSNKPFTNPVTNPAAEHRETAAVHYEYSVLLGEKIIRMLSEIKDSIGALARRLDSR